MNSLDRPALRAKVVATCGPDHVEWVKSLGADEVIDYTKTDITQWAAGQGHKADIAIDCIGRKALEDAWWVVKEGRTLISIFKPPEGLKPAGLENNIKTVFFIMETNGEQLQKVTGLIEGGTAKPALDSAFPFDQFQEAFKRVASGKMRGKVVFAK